MDAGNVEIVPCSPSSHDTSNTPYIDIHEIEVAIPSPQSPQASYHQSDDEDDDDDFFSFPNSPALQPLPPIFTTLNWRERVGDWWRRQRENRKWWVVGFVVCLMLVIGFTVFFLVFKKGKNSKIEFVVSKDGNGEFRSISEALEASPSNSNDPIYINIENGEYYELINVGVDKTNIVLKGAGIDRTMIVSNESLDGNQSASTLRIAGDWFLARDITIVRKGNRGVAVENWSDYSVFYNCQLKGVNGSLNAKRGNQFYRSCDVHGQNHLISGYTAAVYFQISSFFAESEKAIFSSQSSLFIASNNGITFDRCSFYAVGGGQRMKNSSAAVAYLGELLGKYSKIVVIQSYLDESIDYVLVNNTFPNTAQILISDNYDGPGAAIRNASPHVVEIGDIKAASKLFSLRVFLDKSKWKLPDIDYDLDFST